MPPFLSTLRSRTNSMLDNITGVIPDSPSDSTSKLRSLTCGRCGSRFRDRLELSLHYNMMPHHSDYKDNYDFDSFTRPKARRRKPSDKDAAPISPITASVSFSETQAHYDLPGKDKENDAESAARPSLLRKFPTFSNLVSISTGEQSQSPSATDYIDPDAGTASAKAKGKQKAKPPRLPRDGSFQYGLPLGSDEESEPAALASRPSFSFSRTRSATLQGLTSEPRASMSSLTSFPSRSSGSSRQAPPLPPKLPEFDWQNKRDEKRLPSFPLDDDDDTASIVSDSSFRTAGSTGMVSEKAQLKAFYANEKSAEKRRDPPGHSASSASVNERPSLPSRHGSQSNLLMETMDTHHEDAPPSYHELHGDADPFDLLPSSSRRANSRSEGYATMPTSPVSRFEGGRPRRSTNEWSSFASPSRRGAGEDDLYSPRSEKPPRPVFSSKSTEISLPPLIPSASFSASPEPSTPRTPFFTDAPLVAPPLSLPRLQSPTKSGGAGRRSRQHSRAKSDANEPSTRCPTCFVKFSSLERTMRHLDESECGMVDFDSGIV